MGLRFRLRMPGTVRAIRIENRKEIFVVGFLTNVWRSLTSMRVGSPAPQWSATTTVQSILSG